MLPIGKDGADTVVPFKSLGAEDFMLIPALTNNESQGYEVGATSNAYMAYKAFDRNLSYNSNWQSNLANKTQNQRIWVKYPNPVKPIFGIMFQYGNSDRNGYMTDYVYQYSDDGVEWHDASTHLSATSQQELIIDTLNDAGAHKYWGVYVHTLHATSFLVINCLQFISVLK